VYPALEEAQNFDNMLLFRKLVYMVRVNVSNHFPNASAENDIAKPNYGYLY
jgi:hypothetical protein